MTIRQRLEARKQMHKANALTSVWADYSRDPVMGRLSARSGPFVRSEGNLDALIMVVGAQPGSLRWYAERHDHHTDLMLHFLHPLGLNFGDLFCTPIIKQEHGYDKLPHRYYKEGWLYIQREIDIIQPAVVLLLGTEPVRCVWGWDAKISRINAETRTTRTMLGYRTYVASYPPAFGATDSRNGINRQLFGQSFKAIERALTTEGAI